MLRRNAAGAETPAVASRWKERVGAILRRAAPSTLAFLDRSPALSSGGLLSADHVELCLLLVAERVVEAVERGADVLDRLQHRVQPHGDRLQARRRGGRQGGRTGICQVVRGFG